MTPRHAPVGPNFFVIGAQRSGTTRICELLSRHSQIAIPTKEPAYFQSTKDMAEKKDWYDSLFRRVEDFPRRGDGSTYYSMRGIYPGTAERIHRFAPEALILYFVRHPLERIESAWAQLLSVGHANSYVGFERTLLETPLLIDPSLYWEQLGEYRRLFGDERIRLGFFEDFVENEAREIRSCLRFLQVDPSLDLYQGGAGVTRNSRIGKRQRLRTVDAVRAMPGYSRIKSHVPQAMKTLFTKYLTRAVPSEVLWSETTRRSVIAQLADDTAALLRYAGKEPNYWTLA